MGKQEKRDKKAKQAKKDADRIIAEAKARVKEEAPKRKRGQASDEDIALGQRVKELRDQGKPWWQCAYELGLPGSADGLPAGKPGAHRARTLYKAAFGALPERVHKTTDRERAARKDVVKAEPGKPIFTEEDHADTIIEKVLGKRVSWDVYTPDGEFIKTDTAVAHERAGAEVLQGNDGKWFLRFRESAERDTTVPMAYRPVPGQYRNILLERIVRVGAVR